MKSPPQVSGTGTGCALAGTGVISKARPRTTMKPHTFISHPPQGNRATTAAANVLAAVSGVPSDQGPTGPGSAAASPRRTRASPRCSRLARDARERRAAAVSDLGPIAFEKTYAVKYA